MAIMNSALAVGGSSPISATPPKMNRVMPFMFIPYCRATREWQNSWATMETKSPRAPTTPMTQ